MSEPTVALVTLGCKVNQCDSGTLAQDLSAAGLRLVGAGEGPDVVVVNTCGVTGRANAHSRQTIRRVKATNPRARIVATGCYAATAASELARLGEVDEVVGIGREEELVQAVTRLAGIARGHPADGAGVALRPKMAIEGHSRAFLKVQEGCDLGCAFCIVPRARGRSRSVAAAGVLGAIADLRERGFQEVVLCGPNLGGWGRDFDPVRELADLVEAIADRSPIPRLRLSSVNPNELTHRLIAVMAHSAKICPHLHIPIQTGDERLLQVMRRRYDLARVRELMDAAVDRIPDVSIGTDLIVGFPGEDSRSFATTLAFLRSLPLSYLHVFPFSPRPGTPAARLGGRITGRCLRARVEEMAEMARGVRHRFWARFLGRTVEVLVETKRDRASGLLRGYTRHYVRVLLAGDDALMNRRLSVRLCEIAPSGVLGIPGVS